MVCSCLPSWILVWLWLCSSLMVLCPGVMRLGRQVWELVWFVLMSPFLNIGVTVALFQSDGVVPWCNEAWKTSVRAGVICSDVSRSRRVGSSSGPLALCGFKPDSSFSTPLGVTLMFGRSGMPLGPRSGVSVPFSFVKTEENWSFNMSAFSLGSSLGMPSFLSGEMPLLSHFLSPRAHVAKFYGRLRLIRSVWEHPNFPC